MPFSRTARTEHPIHEVLSNRWSPYQFRPDVVPDDDLAALFTAAAWAASSFNAQPWHYIVGCRGGECFSRILGCLNDANRVWAGRAPVLALGIARLDFSHNNKPNRTALHDLGAASASLTVEATTRGLCVHQMAGLDTAIAANEFNVPDNYLVVTGIAIGFAASESDLPENLIARDHKERIRRPLAEFVFTDNWGQSIDFGTGA